MPDLRLSSSNRCRSPGPALTQRTGAIRGSPIMMYRMRTLHLPFAVAAALAVGWSGYLPATGPLVGVTAALADDDDDDGDDGGYSGGGGYSGEGSYRRSPGRSLRAPSPRRLLRGIRRAITGQAPAPRRSQARPIELPERADDEVVATGIGAEQRDRLVADGYAVLDEIGLAALGAAVVKLRVPDGVSLEDARAAVRAIAPDAAVDFNHYYRPEQADCEGPHCIAPQLVGWPQFGAEGASCSAPVRIGLVDTGINPEHTTFDGGRLETVRIGEEELAESGRQHGTAVAALLVGAADSRTPGLLPGAEMVAIDAFHRAAQRDDRTDAFTLVHAIDMALERRVSVLNLSLAGPANDLLADAVARAAETAVIVAAVGNGGPNAEPAYPAAYTGVIGVTAIDRNKRVYRRAGRGDHVDLAAPGVEVWTAASISGGRPKTGTSFAAPFVTAAAALIRAGDPDLKPADVKQRLLQSAQDLGDPGRDPTFGWGLLDASSICGQAGAPAPAAAETALP